MFSNWTTTQHISKKVEKSRYYKFMSDRLPFFSINKGTLIHLGGHDGNNAIFSLYTEQICIKKKDEDEAIILKVISYSTCQWQ